MKIILFDGTCNVCNASVQFIIKRDPKAQFHFASLQSEVGQKLLQCFNVHPDLDTIVLIDERKMYTASSAVLRICKYLPASWKVFYGFIIVPKPLRDIFYRIVAKNRHRFLQEKTSCILPTPDVTKRFLRDEKELKI